MNAFSSPAFEQKIFAPEALATHLSTAMRPLVFTNGCFDLVHRGHVTCLAQARALGQSLVVALNTDESVKRLGKGEDRPINVLADRLAVIAALESVSYVTWFDEDTPLSLIQLFKPEILVKGGDWAVNQIVGSEDVLARGGQVYSIPFLFERSTTSTLAKIRR